ITGLLHTKGKINPLLSGILMMIALYSVNLRIMGKPQLSLLNEITLNEQLTKLWEFTGIDHLINNVLESIGLERFTYTCDILFIMLFVTIIIKLLVDYYLKTEIGLALRATGNNQKMIRSFSANTDILIIMGIGL